MFYDILGRLCREKGVSMSEAVEAIGMNRSNVTSWSSGINPSSRTIAKLAAYFGVTAEYLCGNAQKENAPAVDNHDKGAQLAYDLTLKLNAENKIEALAYLSELLQKQDTDTNSCD